MTASHFSAPVSIFVGLGFPYEVENAWQACVMLMEWAGSRGPAHAMALTRCREASTGAGDLETARLAFEAFAREVCILAPDALDISAANAAKEWLPA
jgi:hypothetical protein